MHLHSSPFRPPSLKTSFYYKYHYYHEATKKIKPKENINHKQEKINFNEKVKEIKSEMKKQQQQQKQTHDK